MKVFISWSGERSRKVALLLDEWLECVIQSLDPWVSSKDIDRGSLWFSEISDQLANTTVGIVCLTKENKNKPWILFESGALAKGLSSNRVCTFLIDLKPTDLQDPLAQFNHTLPNKDSVWGLVRTINNSLGEKALAVNILERVFETYWPQFEAAFTEIIKVKTDDVPEEKRNENDILLEVLSSVRGMERRLRNLESEKDTPPEKGKIVISSAGSSLEMIKRRIRELMQQKLPKEEIIARITDRYGLSRNFVETYIDGYSSANTTQE